tara:strand:- start:44 stop:655 length:612 start_codon:yes stop_codon:yes gene_type:complete
MILDLHKAFYWRRQTRDYIRDKYPEEDVIKALIQRVFCVVPSKQNLFPYAVKVIGPEPKNDKYREELYRLSKHTDTPHNKNCFAPYNLIFTTRLATPNNGMPMTIETGFYQCDPKWYRDSGFVRQSGIEIGMFATLLSAHCLHQNIDVAYMLCFPNSKEEWREFDFINDEDVIFIMSLGYKDKTRPRAKPEERPQENEVIQWI